MKTNTELQNRSWTQFKNFTPVFSFAMLLCLAAASSTAQTYSVLHHFDGDNGWDPIGDLTLSDTTLFGTTYWGGAGYGNYGAGTVFKINVDGSGFTVLKRFSQNDRAGSNPAARLLAIDGMLYGTTARGGISNRGTVFKLSTDGSAFSVLKEFSGLDGADPEAGLVSSGTTLYGTTRGGGISDYGTVFKINTDGSGFSVLKRFAGSDGANPPAGLILSGTTLYGTTVRQTVSNGGTVFKINTDGSGFSVLKNFSGSDRTWLEAELVMIGTTLYGTTLDGGTANRGTVFQMNCDGTGFAVLKSFTGGDGKNPYARLLVFDSTLYGTTLNGGTGFPGGDGYGTVFKLNIDGSGFGMVKQFAISDGARPWAGLVASGSAFYGVTWTGGNFDYGVLYRLSFVPPSAQVLPQSQTAEQGSTVDFAVRATGFPEPEFRWFFNGTNAVDGGTNSIVALVNVQPYRSGSYSAIVTNPVGVVTSAPAMLNVIAAVEHRSVPGVKVTGETGSLLNLDYANFLSPAPDWTALGSVSLTSTSQFYFDLTAPLPPQRFYRAWQVGTPSVVPSLGLNFVPAITLTGNVGDSLRLDYINAIGPTDAWVTLDTVTLTNTSQLYFDVSAPGQPARLYRIVPVP